MTNRDVELDLPSTAALLDLPEQAILRWARSGALPCNKPGETPSEARFDRRGILDWAKEMGMRVPEDDEAPKAPESNALAQSLRRGCILTGLSGKNAKEALRGMVDQMPALEELGFHEFSGTGFSKAEFCERLLLREGLASTAVGEGFAVPHARNPLGATLSKSSVILGRLASPTDWHALDQAPVNTLLLVMSPSLGVQLELLRRIALALRNASLRELLRSEHELETICTAIEALPD